MALYSTSFDNIGGLKDIKGLELESKGKIVLKFMILAKMVIVVQVI